MGKKLVNLLGSWLLLYIRMELNFAYLLSKKYCLTGGAHDSGDDGVSQAVAAVYQHWEQKGPIIYHAIARAFTG